jgi:hypothetical protein
MSGHNALATLLESIEQFVSRLDIYTRLPLTNLVLEIVIGVIVELLTILALATKEFKQRRLS